MKSHRQSSSRRQPISLEPLEGRRLLSAAAWSTSDTYLALGGLVTGTAADSAGNVYMSGLTDTNGVRTYFVRQKPADSTSWTTIFTTPAANTTGEHNELAVDPAGDLFLGMTQPPDANGIYHWQVREQAAGQPTFAVIDDIPGGDCVSLAADGVGDVYALGTMPITTVVKRKTTTTLDQVLRKYVPGPSGFTVSNVYQSPGLDDGSLRGVAAVSSGAATGVYMLDDNNGTWNVQKSGNGGQTWSQVDQFDFDSTISNANIPTALIADHSGNLYVAGGAVKATITGYDKKNRPIYTNFGHWLVRKSVNGGATWTIDDDYQLVPSKGASASAAIGTDLAGNVYVAGSAYDDSAASHAIIRTNAGGSWTTSDDYTGQTLVNYQGFTTGADGTLYAIGRGGQAATQDFFTRSAPDPTVTVASTTFSSVAINNRGSGTSDVDSLLDSISSRDAILS